ncbi:hypothetical protein, partial [Nocardia seriolae]
VWGVPEVVGGARVVRVCMNGRHFHFSWGISMIEGVLGAVNAGTTSICWYRIVVTEVRSATSESIKGES